MNKVRFILNGYTFDVLVADAALDSAAGIIVDAVGSATAVANASDAATAAAVADTAAAAADAAATVAVLAAAADGGTFVSALDRLSVTFDCRTATSNANPVAGFRAETVPQAPNIETSKHR